MFPNKKSLVLVYIHRFTFWFYWQVPIPYRKFTYLIILVYIPYYIIRALDGSPQWKRKARRAHPIYRRNLIAYLNLLTFEAVRSLRKSERVLKIITYRYWQAPIDDVPLHIENLSRRRKLTDERSFLKQRIPNNAFTNIIRTF